MNRGTQPIVRLSAFKDNKICTKPCWLVHCCDSIICNFTSCLIATRLMFIRSTKYVLTIKLNVLILSY